MNSPQSGPPRLAEWLLRGFLPPGIVGDSIVGDAREEYAEHLRTNGFAPAIWYWIHVIRLAGGYVITKGRDVEVGTILKDIKFGARSLMRMPGSAAISVVVLAVGIGLCSFMFSIIYGVYFRGMDIPEAARVVAIFETDVQQNEAQNRVPIQNLADWRARQTAFDGLLAYYGGTINVAGPEEPVRFGGAFVSANTFSLLGVQPILGRGFAVGDDAPGAAPNMVLSYNTWKEHFAGDPSVIGQGVRVNGEPGTILGVMPEGFVFPDAAQVWVPLRNDPLVTARRQGQFVTVYGRLSDGVTKEQAAAQMASIARQLEQEYPEVNEGVGADVLTAIEANMDPQINLVFGAMMLGVICVLLVACANVASLLLARATMRTKEAGIRIAMGGSRLRVMLPFLAESLILASVGALLGMGITYQGVAWFDEATVLARPSFMRFEVDLPILGFVVGIALFTALIAGIVPAFRMSRTDVNSVLKDESRGSSSQSAGRMSRILVTAEVALSCALLVGAGLMTKSMIGLGQAEYPFEVERLFTARVGLFQTDYPDQQSRQQLWTDLIAELGALPQLSAAALTSNVPYDGSAMRRIGIDGVQYAEPTDQPGVNRVVVTPGYFGVLGTSVTTGRGFGEQDDLGSEMVAIVNQPMVDRYFDGRNPLGRQFREGFSDTLPMLTVVGIVPDLLMQGSIPEEFPGYEPAGYYVPLRQADASFMSIAAVTHSNDPLVVTADVRGAVRRLDADLPIYNVLREQAVIDRQTWFYSVFGSVFIIFGVAALFMASVGLYGVLSFAVSRRTQEMGIRMALGAAAPDVVRLVARQAASQLGIGLGIGLAMAFGVTRVISLFLYNVDPQDPVVFAGVFGLIIVVGMSAAVFPARRATSVNPVEALRNE